MNSSTTTSNAMALGVPQLDVVQTNFNWELYCMRLEQFFISSKIKNDDDESKKNVLLTLCTDNTLKLLRGLSCPQEPYEKTYDELSKLIKMHFTTPRLIFQERKAFYEAIKNDNETVTEYLLRLRSLAATCNFGNRFEGNILDKFVTGLSGKMYARLCEEDDWSIEKALSVAKKYELNDPSMTNKSISLNYVGGRNNRANKNATNNNPKRNDQQTPKTGLPECKHCGFKNHKAEECRYKNVTCNNCGNKGHMASICKKSKSENAAASSAIPSRTSNTIKTITTGSNDNCEYNKNCNCNSKNESVESFSRIYSVNLCNTDDKDDPIYIFLNLYNNLIKFQVDTGSSITALPGYIFDKLKSRINIKMYKENSVPTGYGGHKLIVRGFIIPEIHYNNITQNFKIIIIENGDSAIVGRDFLRKFNKTVSINTICNIKCESLEFILNKYDTIFNNDIGKLKNVKARLETLKDPIPKFVKARPVPYAFRKDIENQLHELEQMGIITKTDSTEWGTPLVPILKSDGKIRICADYKITINPWLKETNHPLPRIQDLLTKLSDGKYFSKIDLAAAYNQIELDDESKKLAVWSTHIGNYVMNRLPYGVKPATGIFQRELEKVIGDVPGVINFLDDIVISASDMKTHNERLKCVLQRLHDSGLKVNRAKCLFAQKEIAYLGHTLSEKGIFKMSENNKIIDFPIPTTITEVKSFCGFVNFYGKFINNLSTIMHPIYKLLKSKDKIEWNNDCDEAFKLIKHELVTEKVLCHFNPNLPIVLICDASNVGVGAILAHEFPDKTQKPIEYASRVLSSAEQKYGTIEKEALAIIFATKKFYQYLIGRHFTLITDHKPLLAIFGEKKGIPQMSANRLQRWAFQLSAFNFTIKHVKSSDNMADVFSRLPVGSENNNENTISYVNFITSNTDLPIKYDEIVRETKNDVILSTVIDAIMKGSTLDGKNDDFKPFIQRLNELSVEHDVLMWGYRMIIPTTLRLSILHQIHESHMGIVKTKSIARSYIWWPKIDDDIENMIKSCDACLSVLPNPPKAPVMSWNVTEEPWQRVHIDYAGPFENLYFLIVIDSHSKWIEVSISKAATTDHSIRFLRSIYSRFGISTTLVSDNGSQFTSEKFQHFLQQNGIKHELIAPQHPATNGAAENAVKTVKNALKRALYGKTSVDIETVLCRFLFDYRTTPHCSTGISPAECLFKYKPRTRLDLLKPSSPNNDKSKEIIKNKYNENDDVIVKILKNNRFKWENAQIIKVLGPRNCLCKLLESNRNIKRHVNQIRPRKYCNNNDVTKTNTDITNNSNIYKNNENHLRYFNIVNNDNHENLNESCNSNLNETFHDAITNDNSLNIENNVTLENVNTDAIHSNFEFVDVHNNTLSNDNSHQTYQLRERVSIKKPSRYCN